MSKHEQFTYRIVSDFRGGRLSRSETAELLQVHQRTVSRISKRMEQKGFMGVKHGNMGKSPVNKVPEDLKRVVMELVEKRYYDFNMSHCLEILKDQHGLIIKRETFRKWCHELHMVKRAKRRRGRVRNYRVRMPNTGLLLQFDGSHHHWNRKDEWCLLAAIDDATSEIPHAEFFLSEDTLNCMTVMQRIIEKKGIPEALYVDCAGWFGGQKRQDFAQFKRACEELDIKVLFASSPQAKGRIERTWDTFQDRLIPEMRLRNIHRIPAANCYLQEQFLANYWNREKTVVPRSLESKYRPLSADKDLNEIFCLKEHRRVNADHTISWNGALYKIPSPVKYSIYGQKIEIRSYQNLTWRAFFADKEIALEAIQQPKQKAA